MTISALYPASKPTLNLDFVNSPVLDQRITFTRASSATRYNRLGALETVAANQPRFDYDPITLACKGLLIEEQRTNLLLNSETLATQSITTTAAPRTLSFYGTGTVTLSGTHSATVVGLGVYPTRTIYTYTPTAGTLTLTVTGEVKYANDELGAFATSWIPTTGASATRAADVASMILVPWYNASEGTLLGAAQALSPSFAGGTYFATLSDGTTSNLMSLAYIAGALCGGYAVQGGVAQTSAYPGNVAPNVSHRVALAYAANNAETAVNGVSSGVDNSFTVPAVTTLYIGSRNGAAIPSGHIKRIAYYPRRLTNTELQAITA